MTALQRLGPEVSNHFLGGTPMEADLLHVHSVAYKEVPNIYVPRALATRGPPVSLQED